MTLANINGVNLNYEVTGQGLAVVFLHGGNGSTQDWSNQIEVLSLKYKVVALDIRGHGKSAAPKNEAEYSIPTFAEDVRGLLDLLGIRTCCLAGHSLGGYIALQFALSHQDRLAGLVLVDTASQQLVEDPKTTQLLQKLYQLARSQGVEAAFKHDDRFNPTRIERLKKHPESREKSRRTRQIPSREGYLFCPRAVAKWQPVTPRLSEIKIPTLIYWGDEDKPFVEAVIILKNGISGSVLETIKDVGHNPHQDAPEIFNRALLKFLKHIGW
jgi:pimeloyl-ACP methyl ester carboxylesterase